MLWSGDTECFAVPRDGLNVTKDNPHAVIEADESVRSPSTHMCIAYVLGNGAYLNGTPQKLFRSAVELALALQVWSA